MVYYRQAKDTIEPQVHKKPRKCQFRGFHFGLCYSSLSGCLYVRLAAALAVTGITCRSWERTCQKEEKNIPYLGVHQKHSSEKKSKQRSIS